MFRRAAGIRRERRIRPVRVAPAALKIPLGSGSCAFYRSKGSRSLNGLFGRETPPKRCVKGPKRNTPYDPPKDLLILCADRVGKEMSTTSREVHSAGLSERRSHRPAVRSLSGPDHTGSSGGHTHGARTTTTRPRHARLASRSLHGGTPIFLSIGRHRRPAGRTHPRTAHARTPRLTPSVLKNPPAPSTMRRYPLLKPRRSA